MEGREGERERGGRATREKKTGKVSMVEILTTGLGLNHSRFGTWEILNL